MQLSENYTVLVLLLTSVSTAFAVALTLYFYFMLIFIDFCNAPMFYFMVFKRTVKLVTMNDDVLARTTTKHLVRKTPRII